MINKSLIYVFLFLAGMGIGIVTARSQNTSFTSLDSKQMQQTIIAQRDLAIQKAITAGDYKCCINPPCTMCYLKANPWNNFTAGTCACDELVAQGKEPCPQCKAGLCSAEEENKNSCSSG